MAANLIIKNVTVIDGSGGEPAPGTDVLIRDGVFAAVGPTVAAQPDAAAAEVLDGSGRYLLPGLWEAHTHLRGVAQPTPEATQTALDATLRAFLARGITAVVDLGGPVDVYSQVRERQRTGPLDGARLRFAGPNFTGINGWPFILHHDPTCTNQAGDAETALAALQRLLPRQPDIVKVMYDGEPGRDKLPREALTALIREAHAHGLRAVVHVHSAEDTLHALEAGADGIEHSFLPTPGQEAAEAERVTAALLRTGAYLTPTLAIWEQLARAGDADYLTELIYTGFITAAERDRLAAPDSGWGQSEFPHHPKVECRERLEAAYRFLPTMQAAGVKLVAGSDLAIAMSRPAAALREMALLARAGVPTGAVLVAATRHAAAKVGVGATFGRIAPGQVADAVLLNANPLADLDALLRPGHLVATLKDGRAHPPAPAS
jgi:imidazolonepropionase-like amidohydrolase